ncbi:hypothetical protein TRFO_04925 [Tritrichomonas foetus]|uniref:Uncharacterized protein n=1 Tax=Tritrichomonas foetus TaxID=1144522 RepID=A0A1J4KFD6_9EUKA|nr:hypothetical protein TRFO_04925 [Tritrichomonas foetus]|eukprot:OHT08310.1 hypothetical protein TRFO_04925 [Tritrichomonas foetus]
MLLFLIPFIFSLTPNNLTELCINRIGGSCGDIFEIEIEFEMEYLFKESTELKLLIINDNSKSVHVSLNGLKIKSLQIIGGSNTSTLYLDLYNFTTYDCDFSCTDMRIIFSYGYSNIPSILTFHNIIFNNCVFYNGPTRLNCTNSMIDSISLDSFQQLTFSQLQFNTIFLSNKSYNYILGSQSADSNTGHILVTVSNVHGDYNLTLQLSGISFYLSDINMTMNFSFKCRTCDFLVKDISITNTIKLFSSVHQDEIDYWFYNFYWLSIFHNGILNIDMYTDEVLIQSIVAISLNIYNKNFDLANVGSNCFISQFSSADDGVLNVYISENVTLCFSKSGYSDVNFFGEGEFRINNGFEINTFYNLSVSSLTFVESPAINVRVTANSYGSYINIQNELYFDSNITFVPIYDELYFSPEYDSESLLNRSLVSICAPNIDKDRFDIKALITSVSSKTPPGFSEYDMSFSLEASDTCVSFVFSRDPKTFYSYICIYTMNDSLCNKPQYYSDDSIEQYTMKTYNASNGESPFDSDIDEHYIIIDIPEVLPGDYIFNLASLNGKHEVTFNGHDDVLIKIQDSRNECNDTELVFNNTQVIFLTDKSSILPTYKQLTFSSGASIDPSCQTTLNLSLVTDIIIDFQIGVNFTHFYSCPTIILKHINADSIVYTPYSWIFIKDEEQTEVFCVGYIKCSFYKQESIKISSRTSEFHPLTFNFEDFDDMDELTIEFSDNFINPESAIILEFDNDWSLINIVTHSGLAPLEMTGFAGAISFDEMDAISPQSALSNISYIQFTKPLVFNEKEISYFGIVHKYSSNCFNSIMRDNHQISTDIDEDFYQDENGIQLYNVNYQSTSKTFLPAYFPELIINSDVFLLSMMIQDKKNYIFSDIFLITDNLTINFGSSTIIFTHIEKNITLNSKTTLSLFHSTIGENASIKFIAPLSKEYPQLRLIGSLKDIVMTSDEAFYINDDTSYFSPKNIIISHELDQDFSQLEINETYQYYIVKLRQSDNCQAIKDVVIFDPPEIEIQDGSIVFNTICTDKGLAVTRKIADKEYNVQHAFTVWMIILCSLCGILFIAMTILFILWMKKRKLGNTQNFIRDTLLLPPSDL